MGGRMNQNPLEKNPKRKSIDHEPMDHERMDHIPIHIPIPRTYHCLLYDSHTCKSNTMDGKPEGTEDDVSEGMVVGLFVGEGLMVGLGDVVMTIGDTDGPEEGCGSIVVVGLGEQVGN
jgi:hypothetical protein